MKTEYIDLVYNDGCYNKTDNGYAAVTTSIDLTSGIVVFCIYDIKHDLRNDKKMYICNRPDGYNNTNLSVRECYQTIQAKNIDGTLISLPVKLRHDGSIRIRAPDAFKSIKKILPFNITTLID